MCRAAFAEYQLFQVAFSVQSGLLSLQATHYD
jgi:hypothetical protein